MTVTRHGATRSPLSVHHSAGRDFVDIKDARLKEHYQRELEGDRQWPEPWISLNPAYETGGRVDDLVREGLLDPECDRIFRVKEHVEDQGRGPFTLHRHQRQAIEVARSSPAGWCTADPSRSGG